MRTELAVEKVIAVVASTLAVVMTVIKIAIIRRTPWAALSRAV